jgi:transcriptional regulator with XRE-family HTH domain
VGDERENVLNAVEGATPYRRGSGTPHPIDVHVGKRIRMRRLLIGMNQETLAQAIGLTFQLIQKYETGAVRVSASRLSTIARALDAPIGFFFNDLPTTNATSQQMKRREWIEQPGTLEFVRHYYAIVDPQVRRLLLVLMEAVAATNSPVPVLGASS